MRAFITSKDGLFWWDEELVKARGDRELLRDLFELGLRATWALRGWSK